ncbi:Hypothetical protein A7982_09095 [Minicystis rosea]|nr:Hypothetical protein A7982_09095 [Minicystis rosea]
MHGPRVPRWEGAARGPIVTGARRVRRHRGGPHSKAAAAETIATRPTFPEICRLSSAGARSGRFRYAPDPPGEHGRHAPMFATRPPARASRRAGARIIRDEAEGARGAPRMKNAEIFARLRSHRQGRSATELAQILAELTETPLLQSTLVFDFARAFPEIPLRLLLEAGAWRGVGGRPRRRPPEPALGTMVGGKRISVVRS